MQRKDFICYNIQRSKSSVLQYSTPNRQTGMTESVPPIAENGVNSTVDKITSIVQAYHTTMCYMVGDATGFKWSALRIMCNRKRSWNSKDWYRRVDVLGAWLIHVQRRNIAYDEHTTAYFNRPVVRFVGMDQYSKGPRATNWSHERLIHPTNIRGIGRFDTMSTNRPIKSDYRRI